MSQRVEGRAFHASGPDKENARSRMDVLHLGSRTEVLYAERRPGHVRLSAMAETVSARYRVSTGQGKLDKVGEFEWSGKFRKNAKVTGKSGKCWENFSRLVQLS